MLSLDQLRHDDALQQLHQQVNIDMNSVSVFYLLPEGKLAGFKSSHSNPACVCILPVGTSVNDCFLPQMEQLQTSLQASNDERTRLEDDLQRNKAMVSC